MKRILLLLAVLFVFSPDAFAQFQKRFINKWGEVTKDSSKAVGYFLYKKLQDSSWYAARFDMKDNLLFKGTYLDEDLATAHGKATFYETSIIKVYVAGRGNYMDTLLKPSSTGYYLNGKKEGTWVDFNLNGKTIYSKSYTADTLNGPYYGFYQDGRLGSSGNYLKGRKEGDWYFYYPDSTIQTHELYKNGNRIRQKDFERADQIMNANPRYRYENYLFRSLRKSGFPQVKGFVRIAFTVDTNGLLIDPVIETEDPLLKKTLMDAIVNSPKWAPATKKNVPIQGKVNLILHYRYTDDD
jgi:antitoxin component YwqK of YwqJK toxin-antitoxin module